MNTEDRPFKILTIDGGGVKGASPAALLAWVEEHAGVRVAEYFDLLVGTSTGGIIVLGLAAGLSAGDLLDFYRKHGPTIFGAPQNRLLAALHAMRQLIRAKHDAAPLEAALRAAFGDRTVDSLTTRVVVPTFDAVSGEIRLIKTPHHHRLVRDGKRTLVEAGMATSAAPTYLPGHTTSRGERLLDGGVWANDPMAVAVVEAMGYLNVPRESIRVLSLGTTAVPFHYPTSAMRIGGLQFLSGVAKDLVFAGQTTGAQSSAKVLLGGDANILRLDPIVTAGRFTMDRAGDIPDLIALGEREAMQNFVSIRDRFLKAKAAYPGISPPL